MENRIELPRLTTFNGWLRHHRPDHNNVWGEAVFGFAFPKFDSPEWTEDKKNKALENVAPELDHIVLQPSQHRRFAGYDFGRGRYYSVSSDQLGGDGGTLSAELSAYRDTNEQTAIISVNDGALFSDDLFTDVLSAKESIIVISIFPASRLRLAVESMGATSLQRMSDPRVMGYLTDNNLVHVLISPLVSHQTIENVVDLRDQKTRESFCDAFRTGGEIDASDTSKPMFHRPFGDNISTFYEMLPELLDVNIGGTNQGQGGTTQAIGNYLQGHGVSGLVYPSARADAFVEINGGEMTGFGGWNFVDYRDSETIFDKNAILSPWEQRTAIEGLEVQSPKEGQYRGSFQTRGVREFNSTLYEQSFGEAQLALLSQLNEGPPAVVLWGSTNLDLLAAGIQPSVKS